MTDRELLLKAILADPDDDTVRGAYADEIQGDDPERAEFIRVQIELGNIARQQDEFSKADISHLDYSRAVVDKRQDQLRARERELIKDRGYGWCDGLVGSAKTRGIGKDGVFITVDFIFPNGTGTNAMWLTFRRGFIDHIELPASNWLKHADAICAAQPIRKVTLTTVPRFRYVMGGTHMLDGREKEHWVPRGESHDHSASGIALTLCQLEWRNVTFLIRSES